MTLPDKDARAQAIDPIVNCCVSAPAGSGKTELLIQRFLALLARVGTPESIVAITFTRKAAAEMRARLLATLERAAAEEPPVGEHEHLTRNLALAVLEADRERGWGLVAAPGRLRIQTIDSFCGELTRQMPILSGSGGQLSVSEDSEPLYREAVEELLARADATPDDALSRLLLHLDNNWHSATDLLVRLLRRRDQWQLLFGTRRLDSQQRGQLEAVVMTLVEDCVDALRTRLASTLPDLEQLMTYRAGNIDGAPEFNVSSDALGTWRFLSDALLTKSGTWRGRLTKTEGFPAAGDTAKARKEQMLTLIRDLESGDAQGELLALLHRLRQLPDRDVDRQHWSILQALVSLLPTLAAQLLLVFQRRGEVDHAQVALAAINALGSDEAPTDVALRLDYRLEHLLVDEFQDTSSGQFELLRRLTRGWAEHNEQDPANPRTLMVVGDAMQSIYGFREANVGLFIKARTHGIGELQLRPLQLTVNFRSDASIVQWVNSTFESVFPPRDDDQLGAVRYSPSVPGPSANTSQDPPTTTPPQLQVFLNDEARSGESEWICAQLQEGLAREDVGSIAVLGRSRNTLRPLLKAMGEAGIPYAGRDLDPLAQRMVVRDLMTLCEVLVDSHNRFAWLALLRGPWVALDHGDLLAVSLQCPYVAPLLDVENATSALENASISEQGRDRVEAVVAVLRWAEHYRDRLALRVWIEEIWLRLGGPAAHPQSSAWQEAEQFLQLLEGLEKQGLGLHLPQLRPQVERLYAQTPENSAAVQVMTLHKAKGLEFDWVFIPSLDARTARSQDELLLWDEIQLASAETAFLLDIRSAADSAEGQRIFDYLRDRHKQKRALEDARLLYVGCTRAAHRLILTAGLKVEEDSWEVKLPPAGSLLATLGSEAAASATHFDCSHSLDDAEQWKESPDSDPSEARGEGEGDRFFRLASLPALDSTTVSPMHTAGEVSLDSNRLARALGVAVHRCTEALLVRDSIPAAVDDPLRELLAQSLLATGCEPGLLQDYVQRGCNDLNKLLADEWAQWMLSPARPERAAELPLTFIEEGDCKHLILDYLFLDEKEREYWIVDYKTAVPADGQNLTSFLETEAERYSEQLKRYAKALRSIKGEPVRCALYFVSLGQHFELVPGDT